MNTDNKKILLDEIFRFEDLKNVIIRFNLSFRNNWNPIEIFKNEELGILLEGQYWNYRRRRAYQQGQITVGFIRISPRDNLWLLFHVGKVTKDLHNFDGIGYEYENLAEYQKYCGRLIIRYKNQAQTMIRRAESVIHDCEVAQILPDRFDNDVFPGYDNVNVSWQELARVVKKESWRTALQNQKGVYLIVDQSNGKMYVGSAYGEDMLLGRWLSYIKNGHGGNVEIKSLEFDHIKENFRYSILDIFKATVDDNVVLSRESWWKSVLQTRNHGYNRN